ncbi:glutamate--cysteine ligase [Azospirillum thiophilum]|uniref:Glutamate--cysteine ligase n=1 Tax=Azospirillum thiophilum TaxID=528244 RepID=A0AAC8VUK7_9PROT|nr:glutamate--cysteine ligase [Azospirillum thiophilum]ALG69661.1 glutamate--cysteine ligase [Azospirillum thiophilum]KJR66661.1 glutamate--cysteine ligase [Azospirillum thiophilum]
MSAPPTTRGEPITDRRQLVAYLESGCKPAPDWRIGTEHEKFAYRTSDLRPLPYDGPDGIRELLTRMTRFGWQPVEEKGNIIALVQDMANITLEPGGQVELSGAPLETLHQTCAEVHRHLRQVKEVGAELGIAMMGLGFQPKWRRDDIPWMPKGRYKIMRDYMPKVGSLGLDMMTRTCTVQVNLDFASEADMVQKFRVSLALQPIATALFAMSPFTEGKPNGFQSFRSHIWTDTDPDRTGDIPFVFEDGFGFERYVDYLLDTPMYFVYRDGTYIDAAGQSFRAYMDGKLPALPGEVPLITDWADHTTTAFPEVRLKKYLEMRGADGGPWRSLCALPALWVGLLYDQVALDAAWDLVKDWTAAERAHLRAEVPRTGLHTAFRGRTVRDVALEVVAIARDGLARRARNDNWGDDETHFLDTLQVIAESNRSPADELLEKYHGPWGGSVDPVFKEYAY